MKKIKRKITALCLAAMVFPGIPTVHSASKVSFVDIKGINEPLQTLTGSYNYKGGEQLDFSWYVSDFENGEYSDTGVTGSEFYVENKYSGKWIKFIVTCGNENFESAPEQIDGSWGKITSTSVTISGANAKSDDKYIFKVDGESYVLLDTTENDESKFLVLKDKTIGTREFAQKSTNQFNDMAAFLNNQSGVVTATASKWTKDYSTLTATTDYTESGYIGNSAYIQLADVILENINNNHIWRIEERKKSGAAEGERAIKAGIVLPSVSDLKRYSGKAGIYDSNGFWLRTPSGTSTSGAFISSALEEEAGTLSVSAYNSARGIRPMFYLDKSFFADAKIPVSDMGSEVIKSIKKAYLKSELTGAYSEKELTDVFGYSDKLMVNKIIIRDENKNAISDIKGIKKFYVTLEFSNGDNDEVTELYAAVYGADGKLKAIGKDDLIIKGGESGSSEIEVSNADAAEDDELRIFMWDSEQSPLMESYKHSADFSAELSGVYETMQEISVVIKGNPYTDYDYSWYISDSEESGYSEIEGKTSSSIEIKSEYAEKYIKAKVKNVAGEVRETSPRKIGERWGRTSNTSLEGQRFANKADIFSIDGQEFILLDTFESDEHKYLVLTEEPVTTRVYASGGQTPTAIMEWLNGDEFEESGYLPKAIHRHVNNNARWKIEPYAWYNNNGTNKVENYVVGGISLPAVSEVKKYIDKIVIYKTSTGWWTRTPYARESGGDGNMVLASSGDNDNYGTFFPYITKSAESGIRPIFYLDKNFFAEEKIDLNNIGSNVREQIINNYKKSELTAYTAEERDIITNTGYVEVKLDYVMDSSNGSIPITFRANDNKEHTYKFILKADGEVVSEQILKTNNEKDVARILGLSETGTPLKVEAEGSVEWYVSESKNGSYIKTADGTSFTPLQDMSKRFIKAVITNGSESYETEPVQIKERWYGKNQGAPNGEETDNAEKNAKIKTISIGNKIYAETPAENVFKIGGQEFILLDTTNDKNSHFLVMSKKAIGERTIAKNGQIPADIMCWLNNRESIEVITGESSEYVSGCEDYTESGYLSGVDGFTALPEAIMDGIDFEAYWKQEPKMYGGDVERVYRAGISIPSATELERYHSKFGWRDSGTKYTWTRTGQSKAGDGETMLSYNTDWLMGTLYPNTAKSNSLGIRPIFYLKDSFFKDNVVSLDSVGSAVRAAIISNYSRSELLEAGYDEDEILRYYGSVEGLDGEIYHMSANGLENGIYDMEISVLLDGEEIAHDEKNVCYMPEYKRQFMDFYSTKGYCDALSEDWAYDYALKAGVRLVRIGQQWNGIEKEKGVYDFSYLDKFVSKLENDDIEYIFVMAYGNSLYSDTIKTGPANKAAIDAFAKCMVEIAKRYPKIKYIEIYNEPNLTGFWQPTENHRDYTYLLQVCDREMRKVREDIKVIGGALADGGAGWLANMLSKNAYPYADALSNHPYIYWNKNRVDTQYKNKLEGFTDYVLQYGGFKENIITEVGWATHNESNAHGCSESLQALESTKQYIVAETYGITKNAAYNFVNTGMNPDYNEHNFGVVTRDGKAKPAYIANAVMFNKLAGAVACGEITFGENDDISHGYLYNKGGKPILVLWKDFQTKADESTIKGSVSFSGENVKVYNMLGNVISTDTDTVSLGSDLVYVEGLSGKWYQKAMEESYRYVMNSRLKAIGLSGKSEYFNEVIREISNMSGKIATEEEAKNLLDNHFNIANKIIEDYKSGSLAVTERNLSSLLDVVYETGVFVADYYMNSVNSEAEVTAENEYNALISQIKAKEDTILGGHLPYSNAIAAISKDYLNLAERVSEVKEDNPIKAGFIKSRNILSQKLSEIGSIMCGVETLTCDDIVMFATSEDVNLTLGEEGSVLFTFYNYDDKDISGATLLITDWGENRLSESEVNLKAGESTQVSLKMTVPKTAILSGGYGYAYLNLEGKNLIKIMIKLIVS